MLSEAGDTLTLPKSRYAIRVNQHFVPKYRSRGIIIGRFEGLAEFKNMPNPIRDDTVYVVSGIAASLIKRWNFVAPRSDSGSQERGADQTITSTKAFVTFGAIGNES
jgi:hypothetical protein